MIPNWHQACSIVGVKSVSIILLVLTVSALFSGCSKSDTGSLASSASLKAEEFVLKDVVISVGKSEKLVSFNLSLLGNEGFSKAMSEQTDLLKNILLSQLSDLEIKDFNKKKMINKKLKPSLNKFFDGVEISHVKLVNLKEL